jgi:hypothetical protein
LKAKIEGDVKLRNLSPQMVLAALICVFTWIEVFPSGPTLRFTSGSEGQHSFGSLHYAGNALDIGLKEVSPISGSRYYIHQKLKSALGSEFDVVLKATHIHIEYQPKGE